MSAIFNGTSSVGTRTGTTGMFSYPPVTVAAFIYPTAFGANRVLYVHGELDEQGWQCSLDASGNLAVYKYGIEVGITGTVTTRPTAGQWNLVLFTVEADQNPKFRLVTGSVASETNASTAFLNDPGSFNNLRVGSHLAGVEWYAGRMAHLRVYKADLSDAQALELLTGEPTGAAAASNWPMISDLLDISGNGNNLTNANITFDADDPMTGGGGGSTQPPRSMHQFRMRRAA